MSVGLAAEADKDSLNLSASSTFPIFTYGEIDGTIAVSRAVSREALPDGRLMGYAGTLNYIYAGGFFSASISVSGFSTHYANLSLPATAEKTRLSGNVTFSISDENLGAFAATYTASERRTGTNPLSISLSYSRKVIGSTLFFVNGNRTEGEKRIDTLFFGLNFLLGNSRSGSLNVSAQEGKTRESLDFQKSAPAGTGFGHRFRVERTEDVEGDHTFSGTGSGTYQNRYGFYSATYSRFSDQSSFNLSAAGGLVFIKRNAYLSRSITDGFALVKVGEIPGVRVKFSNQEVGRTNADGEVLVPNLISYYPNALSFEAQDLPINYEIAKAQIHVMPPFRGGGVVAFGIKKLQAFIGQFTVTEKGKTTPAEYWGIAITVAGEQGDETFEQTIGRDGEFYLENMPAGAWPARLYLKEKSCHFKINIPESDEIMVDMEEVNCVLE